MISDVRSLIHDEYLSPHDWPWVVGFSGGKDSSTVLQLVFDVVHALPPSRRSRQIHIICTDTLVEIPNMATHVRGVLDRIRDAAGSLGIPAEVRLLEPDPERTFWTLLLGKGYPAPHKQFRWCTDKLKINPANAYIRQVADEHGGALLLLGSRKAESSARSRSIQRHTISQSRYNPHSAVENAFIFRPIEDLETHQVWTYLLQNPPPWGGSNRELITLYRNAGGTTDDAAPECPLVVDKSTPSCGSSRFGCWTCTVVKQDHSLEALMDHGIEWAEPLLDFREELVETRDSVEARMSIRRNGQPGPGPYTFETRRRLLKRLLETQDETKLDLISEAEVARIKAQWRADERIDDLRQVEGLWEQPAALAADRDEPF